MGTLRFPWKVAFHFASMSMNSNLNAQSIKVVGSGLLGAVVVIAGATLVVALLSDQGRVGVFAYSMLIIMIPITIIWIMLSAILNIFKPGVFWLGFDAMTSSFIMIGWVEWNTFDTVFKSLNLIGGWVVGAILSHFLLRYDRISRVLPFLVLLAFGFIADKVNDSTIAFAPLWGGLAGMIFRKPNLNP